MKFSELSVIRRHVKGRRVAIMGLSGSGKSWLTSKLGGKDLDSIGYEQGGKWLVDIKRMPDVSIVSFTGDNEREVLVSFKPNLVLIIKANPVMMRNALRQKVRDYDGQNLEFVRWWALKAFLTDSQLHRRIASDVATLRGLVPKGIEVHVVDNDYKGPISRGWHSDASILV